MYEQIATVARELSSLWRDVLFVLLLSCREEGAVRSDGTWCRRRNCFRVSKVLHEFSKKITCELYIYSRFCFVLEQLTCIIIYEMRRKAINLEMGGVTRGLLL